MCHEEVPDVPADLVVTPGLVSVAHSVVHSEPVFAVVVSGIFSWQCELGVLSRTCFWFGFLLFENRNPVPVLLKDYLEHEKDLMIAGFVGLVPFLEGSEGDPVVVVYAGVGPVSQLVSKIVALLLDGAGSAFLNVFLCCVPFDPTNYGMVVEA